MGWDAWLPGLTAGAEALEAARKALRRKEPGALDSVRRIGHALGRSPAVREWPLIKEMAEQLAVVPEAEVGELLVVLVGQLREKLRAVERKTTYLLVIDDDEAAVSLLREALAGPDRKLLVAATAAEAERLLESHDVAVIIMDLVLSDMDGRNLLMKLRQQPSTARTPILVATQLRGALAQNEALALGADHFLLKPLEAELVSSLVAGRLRRAPDAPPEQELDALTALPDRTALQKAFDRRPSAPSSLAIVDIDQFSAINDQFGVSAGDRILRGVAKILAGMLGASDLVARMGDDAFALLLADTAEAEAVKAVERMLETVRKQRFTSPEGRRIPVAFSAGVIQIQPEQSLPEAVAAAQRHLYFAKAAGRNRVFSSEDHLHRGAKKVLLVDDGETFASIIKHLLGRHGFEVIHVTDGETALASIPRTGVSLVLLDVSMPGMDGFQVLEALRKQPHLDEVPVVMVTRRNSKSDVARAMELGANDYIVKPFKPHDLLSRVLHYTKDA